MESKKIHEKWKFPAFDRINSFQKLFICIAVAVAVYLIVEIKDIDLLTHVMIGWDTFSLCMLVMSWVTFFITSSEQIREQARVQDQSSSIIFIVVLVSTLASILAVLLLLVTKRAGNHGMNWRLPIAIAGMIFSWFLIHTIFTLRYAHIFYGDHPTIPNTQHGGLEFPDDSTPEYIDFAYFSFVLGMTFQVSDVVITSKRFRKLALLHGLVSFGFNTIMIALTINVIAGYGQ
ncbi:MAG TPA: DUF1345 domain-containing protein [Hanamia sp.]|nr:DUF1345 domain-containing protein [Hanamia sp.]